MNGELIAIGDELTSGRIVNSTSYFAASHLFAAGHTVTSMTTVGDETEMIGQALLEAIDRSDFVVLTGGLGSTTDDITSAAVSAALDRPQTFYPEIFAKIQECEAFKNSPAMEKMAWLPSGAEVLKPGENMAGFMLVYAEKPIFFLPGVPHQMRELMLDRVIPILATWQENSFHLVHQKIYKVFGVEEMEINNRLADLENKDERIRIGYYPMAAEVHVSLTVCTATIEDTKELFLAKETLLKAALADLIYGEDEETMASVSGALLRDQGLTLGLAESCTGGLMAKMVTSVPGSSAYFQGSVVAYANEVKERLLGVAAETLIHFGAVSEETAAAMADGARQATGADIGVAITGIAGPDGGTPDKPVGTVCFGLATPAGSFQQTHRFSGKRALVQAKAATMGLDLVRRFLLNRIPLQVSS
ncbi:MAG: CinA family nicotinamide mononucleotide deamidase-related protein [Proteobacteria bacterium]|nr:CinA family nicotinamide mononucleotide deamidase-related protein [Pseudomonadota bacterium]MBU1640642.1 CinA family nicotinamide mononucleotide deamidase-related protein [Pseudomonadota bacterium]